MGRTTFTRIVAVLLLICVVMMACKSESEPEIPVQEQVMQEAMDSLLQGNFNYYMRCVAIDCDADAALNEVLLSAMRQNKMHLDEARGGVDTCIVAGSQMRGDSVCYVFYKLRMGDGSYEMHSQKMIRKDGVWKLRLRN